MIRHSSHSHKRIFRRPTGQAAVIIAIAFIALLAFVGFVVDVGQLYVYMGHLRRAVDASSLAAAAQFREGRGLAEMTASADQVMHLNGVDPTSVTVETCDTNPGDPELCVTPNRKFVRVIGTLRVPMAFLQLVGVNNVNISANAIGEAASMDVVLVIDISESMTNDASLCDGNDDDGDGVANDGRPDGMCGLAGIAQVGGIADNYYADPSKCNPARHCHPFEEVKAAAESFVDRILDLPPTQEADRVTIVTFSNSWEAGTNRRGSRIVPPGWMSNHADAVAALDNLMVYQPDVCPSAVGPCLNYDWANDNLYLGFGCPLYYDTGNPASCTTTNIGGGLKLGANMFASQTREDSLWVLVLLTDGAANSSDPDNSHTFGFCPNTDWTPPFCRDKNSASRHFGGNVRYDADDFARDMADFAGCLAVNPAASCTQPGQGAIVFTIGLGDEVLYTYGTDPIPHGVDLLRYVAAAGDDGDPSTDPCAGLYDNLTEFKTWCGNYYFSPTSDKLVKIFEDIASRMFTRIHH
jgi:Flp pilus assembly protein TadG